MTTFYKKKDEVNLKPGQTLGFTAGKGYYAAGSPTTPKPSPAPAKPSSKAEPTATRPTAAKTPTAPPSRASSPPTTPRAGEPGSDTARGSDARVDRSPASTTPKLSESTAFYRRASDVPLGPSQTLGYAGERGYYAAGRAQPTKASTTPRPSTVKVTALSTRASTESPLVEHRETRDGRTTIRLSHATKPTDRASQARKVAARASERSAKPTKEPARRAAVETKKASSRVHEQLAKNKERSHRPKSGIGHHPGHKDGPLATAASAGDARRSRDRDGNPFASAPPGAPSLFTPKRTLIAYTPSFVVTTSLQAGPQVSVQVNSNGLLTFTSGGHTLTAVSLSGVFEQWAKVIGDAEAVKSKVENALSRSVKLPGGATATVALTASGLSLVIAAHGATFTISGKSPDEVVIETKITPAQKGNPLGGPVNVTATTTISPRPPTRGGRPVGEPGDAHAPAHATSPAHAPAHARPPLYISPGARASASANETEEEQEQEDWTEAWSFAQGEIAAYSEEG